MTAVAPGAAQVARVAPRTVQIAVLGTGNMGLRHLQVFGGLDGVQVVAVPTRPERVEALRQQGLTAHHSLEDARQRGVQGCVIATDTARHADDALAALAQGCDLLIEKPLACDVAQAQQVVARARRDGRRVFVGCVLRFSDSLNAFRAQLPEVGVVHAVRIECQSYLPDWRPQRPYRESYSARAEEGGVLRDLIHEVDYAGWVFGWPSVVQARLANLGRLGIEAEEAAELWWQSPRGGDVSVRLDYLTRPARRCMSAFGEFGTLTWDGIAGSVTLERPGAPSQVSMSAQTSDALFLAQARAFLQASAGVVDARLATAEDGLRALAVCDASRRASASRSEAVVEGA